ncbi:MAG: glucose-6-phosphate isomerase, partial [Parachlamydiaceae bacterium]
GIGSQHHFISVTCPKSPLDNQQSYREVFYMWEWIGGRYSTTSMVGGVLLAFAFGFDKFVELLRGANAMDKIALEDDLNTNLPLLTALLGIWNRNFLHHPLLAIIPYAQTLARFPAHIQQLDMESNGKHIDKHGHVVEFNTGPIIFGEPGTSAQHSFYQLIHQGTTIVPLEFIAFKHPQTNFNPEVNETTSQEKLLANVFAQSIALATGQKSTNPNQSFVGNRPNLLLLGSKLTPFALGALLSFYEHKVAFQGFIWHTNSFDQEGVQLGKRLANKILERFADQEPAYPLGDAFLKELKAL